MTRTPQRSGSRPERGVMLLGLLLMLMLTAIGLMAAVEVWSTARQREQERELLFVGEQYRQAIRRYYYAMPPGKPRVLPATLESLLADDRFEVPVRHLRRLYPDPVTGSTEWGLVLVGDRIAGVHSQSTAAPLKHTGFAPSQVAFEDKASYQDWVFLFLPPRSARR
jgi:type II secretory pathway pseudopilin PulG